MNAVVVTAEASLAPAAFEPADRILVPPNRIPVGADRITPKMLPLLSLSQPEIDGIVEAVPGGAANIADIYPLAPLQEGLLFHHLASEAGDAHLMPFLLGFDRRGRLELFLVALRQVMARHDILRTAILYDQLSQPVQVVMREAGLPVEEVQLSGTSGGDAERELAERYDPRRFRIDIRQAPMMRAFVAHDAGNDRWLLLLLAHHLILDQTSVEVIRHEISRISSGRRSDLPEPEPFRNFVAQARLGTPPAEHETFFREMLGDIDEATLPYGLSRVQGDGSGIREASIVLDATLSRLVRDRARALGVEPASIFHVAWALVLAHVSDRTDVVFGTLVFGRMHAGLDARRTLGMFINTLPMRVKIDATSVQSAVLRTQRMLEGLVRHEHASLALAQRCSGVPAPAPLFSALFNFRHNPPADVADTDGAWPGVELLFTQERTDYPVALAVDDRADDFMFVAQADAPADPAKLCRFMETAVSNLLCALGHSSLTELHSITVLPRTEYEQVTSGWNATDAVFKGGTLHGLFAEQAARTPSAVAVVSRTESVTYDELNIRADSLANVLVARGAGPQTVVGVALERSVSTVVSLLAILKAGAIYLPLDPAYPPDRLAFMIADSGASLLIANIETEALLPPAVPRIDVESFETAPDRPKTPITPDEIAYIIYTSGSTGKPKGVAVPHSAAVNLAFARLRHDPISAGDRILAAISVGFDVSIGQLLLPLLSGAAIVISGDVRSTTPREFWDFLGEFHVTHINSVPSFFESVLDAAPPKSSLVRLMLGGEPFSTALARRLRAALPATSFVNMYGPTEACIDATCYPVTGNETSAFLPIGKPLPNYRAYILNAHMDPVDVGVPGDLYLGGAGLARGYINQPDLTAERFVRDPFGAPGERLYKTGDRAYWRADGNIEFIGRSDTQVKIRGHRVELGEIEANLVRQAGVREAAVIVREDVPGERRLVAYYTADKPLSSELLRAGLEGELPTYMMPAAYIHLTSLPLTVNGKLDRQALQAPADRAVSGSNETPMVVDELQQELTRTWEMLLDVRRVGIRDNFFALGGHSLLAVRLVKEIERRFHVRLPLAVLFEQPTVERLAQVLRRDPASLNRSPLVVLNAAGAATPLFFLHGSIRGGGYYCLPLAEHLGANRPVFAMRPHGVDGGPIPATIEAIAADSINVLKSVRPEGPYLLGGFSSGGLVAFEMARQLVARGEMVENVLLIDTLHAGRRLRQTVELVERFGRRFRIAEQRLDAVCRAISRLWRAVAERVADLVPALLRFASASDKGKLLRTRAAKVRAAFRRRDESAGVGDASDKALQAWERISDSYIPRPYSGRITVLFAKDEPRSGKRAKQWSSMAQRVEIRQVPGTHFTCITEHIGATAREIGLRL